jgi:arylsulfatase A-like enzyme
VSTAQKSPAPGSLQPKKRGPNVLLIITDEERAKLPHPEGFTLPGRERILAAGTAFDAYRITTGMCSPSRSVIYSGQHTLKTGMTDNDNFPSMDGLDPDMATLGTMMRAAGYYTAYKGKFHLQGGDLYIDPSQVGKANTQDALEPFGFSDYNEWGDIDGGAWAGLGIDPVIAGDASEWLRFRAPLVGADQPWFLAVNFVNPHDIMSFDYGGQAGALPPFLANSFATKAPPPLPIYGDQWDFELPASRNEDLSSKPAFQARLKTIIDFLFGPVVDDAAWRTGLNFYLNCIRDVDRSIDTVLDSLVASGVADDTVVIFSSDHGEMAGSHGLRQKLGLVYDENLRVPLIINHPDLSGGDSTPQVASSIDLAPTLLDIAGVEPSTVKTSFPDLHGHSLLPALAGQATGRDAALSTGESVLGVDPNFFPALAEPGGQEKMARGEIKPDWTNRAFLRGVCDDRYSLGRYFSALDYNRPKNLDQLFEHNDVELYDRQEDPDENNNLASDPASREVLSTMLNKLEQLIDDEIGEDTRSIVLDHVNPMMAPAAWHGDYLTTSAQP